MNKKLKTMILGAAAVAWGCWAYADPTLTISDGSTTITVQDGGALDGDKTAGSVTYVGGIGNWYITISTGISQPHSGTVLMHLNTVEAIYGPPLGTGLGGVLNISFQDTGVTYGPGHYETSIGGTTLNGTIDYSVSNGSTTVASFSGLVGPGSFSGDTSFTLGSTSPLIQTVRVSQPGIGSTSLDAQIVPDGGTTVTLLGLGMVALEGLRRKVKKLA